MHRAIATWDALGSLILLHVAALVATVHHSYVVLQFRLA